MQYFDKEINRDRDIKDFELVKKLGSGTQGSVWEAYNPEKKKVALKQIDIKKGGYDEGLKEIKLLQTLSKPECNPFISCLYDSFIDLNKGNLYIEMEFIKGTDLLTYSDSFKSFITPIQKKNMIKLQRHLLLIAKDVNLGLKYLHSKGIIHRDIKPENIMIDANLTPKIVDLGLGCTSLPCEYNYVDIQCCKGRAGTPFYAAPEKFLNNTSYFLSDIWSLGASLYRCATFRQLYEEARNIKQLVKMMKVQLGPRIEIENQLLNNLVTSCLKYDLVERIDSYEIEDMLKDL